MFFSLTKNFLLAFLLTAIFMMAERSQAHVGDEKPNDNNIQISKEWIEATRNNNLMINNSIAENNEDLNDERDDKIDRLPAIIDEDSDRDEPTLSLNQNYNIDSNYSEDDNSETYSSSAESDDNNYDNSDNAEDYSDGNND